MIYKKNKQVLVRGGIQCLVTLFHKLAFQVDYGGIKFIIQASRLQSRVIERKLRIWRRTERANQDSCPADTLLNKSSTLAADIKVQSGTSVFDCSLHISRVSVRLCLKNLRSEIASNACVDQDIMGRQEQAGEWSAVCNANKIGKLYRALLRPEILYGSV